MSGDVETLSTKTLPNGPQDGVQYPIKVIYCGGLFIFRKFCFEIYFCLFVF